MSPIYTAIITDDRFGAENEERAVLEPLGVELQVEKCQTSEDVAVTCRDADALLVNLAPLDTAAINSLTRCRVIARYGVGLDNIDVAAAKARGIAVYNVPDYCSEDVAQHSLALLLALLRDLPGRNQAVHRGHWNLQTDQHTVAGKTIGILGFGSSGQAFCRAVLALKPERVLVYSPNTDQARLEAALGQLARLLDIELLATDKPTLLRSADIISIHLRLSDETQSLFNDQTFAMVKRGLWLVNTARGAMVDSLALSRALDAGIVAGAALDVFDHEPPGKDHPLLGLPRLILSDHCAYRSTRSIALLKKRTAENAARGLGLLPNS